VVSKSTTDIHPRKRFTPQYLSNLRTARLVVHGGVTVRVVDDVVRVVVQCVEVLVQIVFDVFVAWPPLVTVVGLPPFLVEVTVW